MPELKLVAGHTGPIDETLKSNGTPVNLTGLTVALLLQKADGTLVDTAGDVSVPTPAAGVVRYSPGATDLAAVDTPHVARWTVTDGLGKVVYFPSDAGEVWTVQPSAAVALQDNALVTVAELKAALGIQGTEQDLAVADFINSASDTLETLTGRRLKSRAYVEHLFVRAEWVLGIEWLDVEWPITALTGLILGGTDQTIWMPGDTGRLEDKDVYVLKERDPKHGPDRIFRPGGWPVGAFVSRTYTAGYGVPGFPIPVELKRAAILLGVDAYYRQSRQADPVISRSAGAETVTYVNEQLPRALAPLLNAYRRWR